MKSQSGCVFIFALGSIAVHGDEFVDAVESQVVCYGNPGGIHNSSFYQFFEVFL